MNRRFLHLCFWIGGTFCLLASPLGAQDLAFSTRLQAQKAIERVRYSHQIGPKKPFNQAITEEWLEASVRTYLKQSRVLEQMWGVSLTREVLEREAQRILRDSRFPSRLRQIKEALHEDPVLFRECFVRPVVASRLIHSFQSSDRRIHATRRAEIGLLRTRLAGGQIDARSPHYARTVVEIIRRMPPARRPSSDNEKAVSSNSPQSPSSQFTLDASVYAQQRVQAPPHPGAVGPVIEDSESFKVSVLLDEGENWFQLAVYSIPKQGFDSWWQEVAPRVVITGLTSNGYSDFSNQSSSQSENPSPEGSIQIEAESGSSGCVPDDTWDNGLLDDLPEPRSGHTAVWTGTEMIVWGGTDGSRLLQSGSRYDPLTDTWSSISTVGAPEPRENHTAVWTGTEMIVWGGQRAGGSALNTGGRYDPATNSWTATTTNLAASSRHSHTAVWSGTEMIVWGGISSTFALNSGGRYNPASDTWTSTQQFPAPAGRYDHVAVWTGSVMIVWGGFNSTPVNTGGWYNPVTNSWRSTTLTFAPSARTQPSAVWTGSQMVVWGGFDGSTQLNTGGRFDPVSETWSPLSSTGTPSARQGHTAVWTGSMMAVWGGTNGTPVLESGGFYDPVSDQWSASTTSNAPQARKGHTAVWAGSMMIVWGGTDGSDIPLNSGGRCDLGGTGNWTPTSMGGAPSARHAHSAVWTGNEMIIWGGSDGSPLATGSRYDPVVDTWTPVATTGAPTGRLDHTAVWTGQEMLVWGGTPDLSTVLATGGRYDPLSDSWAPITTSSAPSARTDHTAIWTGDEMVIWGGTSNFSDGMNTGGRYNPTLDSWSNTTTNGAPSARLAHTAIWNGQVMVVWGGRDGSTPLNTGSQYAPDADAWSPTSTSTGLPSARFDHTAVWTGQEMVIWGGTDGTASTNTGSRYNPGSNTWALTSFFASPTPRTGHTSVWSGNEMLVWGGFDTFHQNTGSRYNPTTNTWTVMSDIGAPGGRTRHSGVWGDGFFMVWGGLGAGDGDRNTGGRYAMGQDTDQDADGVSTCGGDCDDSDPAIYPGAVELCNGIDDNCTGGVDEGFDLDSDGFSSCGGDCDDFDPQAWLIPTEVEGLSVTGSSPTLSSWNSQAVSAGPGTEYDLVSGDIGEFLGLDFSTAGCLYSGSDPFHSDTRPEPALESAFWYLPRARNSCGLGTFGSPSRDTSILACP